MKTETRNTKNALDAAGLPKSIAMTRVIDRAVAVAKLANAHFEAAKAKDVSDPQYVLFRERCAQLQFAALLVGTDTLADCIERLGVKCPPFWL